MKLILALILAAGVVSAQTTVNITNSLIGPVTQNFSNTQVNVSQAVITGAVVNASVTNSFAPVNNITNEVTVGGTTVNNTNTFITYITNQVDVAGVVITNIIENIVQSNNYFTTSGVSSISFTGAVDGAIVLAAGNNITIAQTNRTFNISSTASGGGGLVYLQETNGAATQAGAFLFNTQAIAASTFGLFLGTNGAISVNRPDGTLDGGNARGAGSVDLQPAVAGTISTRASASHIVSAPRSFMVASYRSTLSGGTDGYNAIIATGPNSATISAGSGQAIVGGSGNITGAGTHLGIYASGGGTVSAGSSYNALLANDQGTISGISSRNALIGNYQGTIAGNVYQTAIIASESSTIAVSNSSFGTSSAIIGGEINRILSLGTDRTRNSLILGGTSATNAGKGSIAMGYRVNNTNDGNLVFASFDSGTTFFTPVKSNTATFRVPNGFGINTNNPQESLHVDGRIQITGVKIYASGTNLYLTDGSTYTNRINVTPE